MEIRLPQLGEGADSGAVATIFVKEGDQVRVDDPLLELESEKAVATVPSPQAGTVTRVHVREGDTVKVGQVLFTVSEDGGGEKAAEPDRDKAAGQAEGKEPAKGRAAAQAVPSPRPGQPVAAAPSLRKMAAQLGIDLSQVPATGPGGRVLLEDVRGWLASLQQRGAAPGRESPAAAEAVDFAKWGPVARKPMNQMRKVIARRMHEAWAAIPHVTQFDEADLTNVLGLRAKYKEEFQRRGPHLTLLPFIIQALIRVLKLHPVFNSSLDESSQEIVLKEYYHLGIAVDTEQGLIVPVLRNADRKTLLELAQELEALSHRARDRKLTAEDLRGGSFTISNQGGIGGGHYTPIINRPEVAILGLGRAQSRPVVRERDAVVVRPMLPLTISYDHRVADGAQAARFVVDLVKELEGLTADALRL